MARRRVLGLSSGGGITNGAGNNVIPKSNGTNLVASSLTDTGTVLSMSHAGTQNVADFSLTDTRTSNALNFTLDSNGSGPLVRSGSNGLIFGNSGSDQFQISLGSIAAQITGVTALAITATEWQPSPTATVALGDSTHAFTTTFTANVRGITAFLTSNYTNATTTFSNVTGLSFPVAASQNYKITCDLDYQTSATTADIKIQWTGPASPTAVTYDFKADLTATTSATDSVATAFSTSLAGTGTPTITTNLPLGTTMTLINGANAGTVQLQAAATGTGTITIIPGSCVVTQ